MSTSENVQNNYIKVSGFNFNKTRLPQWRNCEKPIKRSAAPKLLLEYNQLG